MEYASPSRLERRLAGGLVKTVFLRGRRSPPRDPPAHLASEPLRFEGNTGARLVGRWFPAERPRGAAVLAHPDKRAAGAWFVKAGWVDFLHGAGYDVLTFDFVGYGGSDGPATYYHEDILAAVEVARRWGGGLPVSVVGVSMGAFAAANASPRLENVAGLVLESPYPSFNSWYGRGWGRWAMEAFDRLFPRTSASIQADRNIVHARPPRILVGIAESDEVTPPALSEAIARRAPTDRTAVVRVPGARHLALVEDETYRQSVLKTLG